MGIFIVYIAIIPLQQKADLNLRKKYVQNKIFCNVEMPSETYQNSINTKSDKVPFLVYADLE